jgi:hypothetical protein
VLLATLAWVGAGFWTPVLGQQYPKSEDPLLRPGCDDCEWLHVWGEPEEAPDGGVATPLGTTYSVHHRVGADLDDGGPDGVTCAFIHHPANPGAPDDIVTFDAVEEAIRTNVLGTVPKVKETDTPLPNGQRRITIETSSPFGTDLFPGGFQQSGRALTDACFSVGLHDPLSWASTDTIISATMEFLKDNVVQLGPLPATSFFVNPWNGVVTITLPGGAGDGYNGVRLAITVVKTADIPNNDCRGQIEVFNGVTVFSTVGASTDGPPEPACNFEGADPQIGSDIWYVYTATCTGTLSASLCNSNFDTKLAVYDWCLCELEPGPISCNDDYTPCGLRSLVQVPVTQGECYTIRVGGYFATQGNGSLNISCTVTPPPTGACCDLNGVCTGTMTQVNCSNQQGTWFQSSTCPSFQCPVSPPPHNECDDCIRVETGVPYEGRTNSATTGTDLTTCESFNDTRDVWHCWTADCSGRVTMETCGSGYDTTLAVYDVCGGGAEQLACNDDSGCPDEFRSRVELDVTAGRTYRIRVAGFNQTYGPYRLLVNPCQNACCRPNGSCLVGTQAQCDSVDGTWLEGVRVCREDLNGNGVNDACEPCPTATIDYAIPAHGTVDGRQPYARNSAQPRHGIGFPGSGPIPREPVIVVLDPPLPLAEGCFDLCETGVDSLAGVNSINTVTYQGAGMYELRLTHAIPAGAVTTIEYRGDGSFVSYIAHPSNADGSAAVNAADIQHHIDCCLKGTCTPTWGTHSCEIDHSTKITPADLLILIDLQNGTQLWDPWANPPLSSLPINNTCPPPGGH